jgi:glyoxylase-like metal-dependent hydrolase (beta-lactamase superfamily II)
MNRVAARRRKWLAGFLTLLIVAIALVASFRRKDLGVKVPLLDGSTITIVPGIHLLGGLGPAAAYAIETSDGLVLIDAGLDSDAKPLKAEMAKLGLDWKKVRAILLTHIHGDHSGGAEHLRAATGAKIYAGQGDASLLKAGAPREAFFSTYRMPNHTPHPTTVDVALEGRETIAVGAVRIQVLDTPGHTPGSMCYLMEREGLRVLFSGDVIVGLGDVPLGTYSTYLAPRYRGDAKPFRASLRMLRTIPVPNLVLPGHPSASREPQSPRLTRERWETMLDAGIDEMGRLIARHEADGAGFLDGEAKQLLPGLYYLGDFHDSAVYGFFASSKFFVVDAPGGPGLADFLNARMHEMGLAPAEPTAVLLTACGERETAGLEELIERSHALVVAGPAGVAGVGKRCPPGTTVIPATDLPDQGWFPVKPLLLQGRGMAPVAYLLPWAEKKVLFSGRIPAGLDEQSREELLTELAQLQTAEIYISSLRQLVDVRPDVWLPASPSNGQNANLYDRSWTNILEKNYMAGQYALQRP